MIQGGPNQGVLFATEVPVKAASQIQVNSAALAVNSDFYNRQPTNGGGTKCKRSDVVPFLPPARAHEGENLEPLSHARVYHDTLNAYAPMATESAVGLSATEIEHNADLAAQPAIVYSQNIQKDVIEGGIVPPVPYCTFKYF
jgi:hypothetical protein